MQKGITGIAWMALLLVLTAILPDFRNNVLDKNSNSITYLMYREGDERSVAQNSIATA